MDGSGRAADWHEKQWIPDPCLGFLSDHFPGRPIVPGYYQIHILRRCLESWAGVESAKIRFKAIKFLTLIAPGDVVLIRAERKGSGATFSVALEVSGRVVTQGEVTIA